MSHLFILLFIISLYALSLSDDRKGYRVFLIALFLHLLYVLYRTFHLGHPPITDKFDILLSAGLLTGLYQLYLKRRWIREAGYLYLLPVLFVFLALFQERIDTISSSMNSSWFYLHAGLLVIALSLLTTGSVIGLLYLKNSEHTFELLQYRITLAGWLFFSLSIIAGSIWFFLAQGVYWLWTAKELWLTITWFYYSLYLHGRYVNFLKGERAAEIGVAGVFVLFFSYLGVTPILGSPWTQF
jgi:hypothetical protein